MANNLKKGWGNGHVHVCAHTLFTLTRCSFKQIINTRLVKKNYCWTYIWNSPLRIGTWDAIWSTFNHQLLLFLHCIIMWKNIVALVSFIKPQLRLGMGKHVNIRYRFQQMLGCHTTANNWIKHVQSHLHGKRNCFCSWTRGVVLLNSCHWEVRFYQVLYIFGQQWRDIVIFLINRPILSSLRRICSIFCRPMMISLVKTDKNNKLQIVTISRH